MRGIVVSLCDLSGKILIPWAEAGYDCYAIDLQHDGTSTIGKITFVQADIMECVSHWLPAGREIAIAFGFPPCTHTAVSGAKHFRAKGAKGAAEAFQLIARTDQLLRWFGCPWLWEQPVATTSTYVGLPDRTFDPCDFAGYLADPSQDAYTKKTCIWSGGGLIWPAKKPVTPVKVCAQGSWVQKLGGSSQRTKNLRSATPEGFAQAIFQANEPYLER
jgi:hypothetical protein